MSEQRKFLIVTLESDGRVSPGLTPLIKIASATSQTIVVTNDLAAVKTLQDQIVSGLLLSTNSDGPALHNVLRAFSNNIGPLPGCQFVFAPKVTQGIINAAFEAGVEQVFDEASAYHYATKIQEAVSNSMSHAGTRGTLVEEKIVALTRAIRVAHQEGVLRAITELQGEASNDYRAAICVGRGYEARSDFENAQLWYATSAKLNPWFRPARFALAEVQLISGKHDLALDTLNQLELEYSRDVDRKSALASVFLEKNDYEKARSYALEAQAIAPNHSRTMEALALIHMGTKEFPEAFALIDRMTEVGPYFAAKMNEVGIHLSQSGDFKSALMLYEKAHKVVRPELRFKISMNSALALRKLNEFEQALRMVERCEREYGGNFPKLEKLRNVLHEEHHRLRGGA